MTAGWIPQGPGAPTSAGWAPSALAPAERQDLNITATLDRLAFQGRHTPVPPRGWVFHIESLSGWWDAAPDKTETIDHWSGDGVVSLLRRTGARLIEVKGHIKAEQKPAPMMLHAMEALKRHSRSGVLTVDEHLAGRKLEADVSRVDLVYGTFAPWQTPFTLILRADDPLQYSPGSMTLRNGRVDIPNRGDAVFSPVLDLVGPHGAISIVHPGGTYTFKALAANQRRTLDFRNGDVWKDNVRTFGEEGGRRPAILAGGSPWTVAGLGAGTATLRRYEAWT